jgi:hypothetical protein
MKQCKPKKQPTRDDLASAWKMIRDQSQIIGLQADTISRQNRFIGGQKAAGVEEVAGQAARIAQPLRHPR